MELNTHILSKPGRTVSITNMEFKYSPVHLPVRNKITGNNITGNNTTGNNSFKKKITQHHNMEHGIKQTHTKQTRQWLSITNMA